LRTVLRASTAGAGVAQRARIVLLAAEGVSNAEIGRRVGVSSKRRTMAPKPGAVPITAIENFIDGWNDRCTPFIWTKTADQILAKAHRETTSNTRHWRSVDLLDPLEGALDQL